MAGLSLAEGEEVDDKTITSNTSSAPKISTSHNGFASGNNMDIGRASSPNKACLLAERKLGEFFPGRSGPGAAVVPTRSRYTDADLQRIANLLQLSQREAWSSVPRIYTVLRCIGQLPLIDDFINDGFSDIWFPFTPRNLPSHLSPSIKAQFISKQSLVFTQALDLEKGENGKHATFAAGEPLWFESRGKLGRGAFGVVDKVVSLITLHEYARKRMRRGNNFTKSRKEIQDFKAELAILKTINHIHCVRLVGSYTDPAYVGLIMDPVADCDLAAFLIAALNNNDMKSLLRNFFGCLVGALQYLHERQIRHRDIKPPNILVKGDCIYLADFGIALDWSEMTRGTTTADTAKSPIYCAPEVARCEPRGPSSDIWSLGCVFVEMVSVLKGKSVEDLRTNFKAKTQSYMFHYNIEPCKQWLADLKLLSARDNPPITWSLNMLSFDRSERYTADQLLDAIRLASTHNASRIINESFCGDCCLDDENPPSGGSSSESEDVWADSGEENTAVVTAQPSADLLLNETVGVLAPDTLPKSPINVEGITALRNSSTNPDFVDGPANPIAADASIANKTQPEVTQHLAASIWDQSKIETPRSLQTMEGRPSEVLTRDSETLGEHVASPLFKTISATTMPDMGHEARKGEKENVVDFQKDEVRYESITTPGLHSKSSHGELRGIAEDHVAPGTVSEFYSTSSYEKLQRLTPNNFQAGNTDGTLPGQTMDQRASERNRNGLLLNQEDETPLNNDGKLILLDDNDVLHASNADHSGSNSKPSISYDEFVGTSRRAPPTTYIGPILPYIPDDQLHLDTLTQAERNKRLLQAVKNKQVHEVNLLIHADASLAYSEADGNTALHFAALNGCIEVIKLLLQNGADVRAKNLHGCTPLDLTSHSGERAVALLLAEPDGGIEAESPPQDGENSLSPQRQKGLNRSLSPVPASEIMVRKPIGSSSFSTTPRTASLRLSGSGGADGGSLETLANSATESFTRGDDQGVEKKYESAQEKLDDTQTAVQQPRFTKPNSLLRVCQKCGLQITGQFVRALGSTFHLECFTCKDCGKIIAQSFFPLDDTNGQITLCETDYFRRLDLLCHKCGGALRGSYMTAFDKKYHIEHFTCSVCPKVFGAEDSYYENEAQVYCLEHYVTMFAQHCSGCKRPILKQFVEILRNGMNQHWHPECYMVHKFWNVCFAKDGDDVTTPDMEAMETIVQETWTTLSSFEEISASYISEYVLHASNGSILESLADIKGLIDAIGVLFFAVETLHEATIKAGKQGLQYNRESKLLCKKIVACLMLSRDRDAGVVRKTGVTQELLSLATALAHYLKLVIRILITGAIGLGLPQIQSYIDVMKYPKKPPVSMITSSFELIDPPGFSVEDCHVCNRPVEAECARWGRILRRQHLACENHCINCHTSSSPENMTLGSRVGYAAPQLFCSTCNYLARGNTTTCQRITKLQQYVFLLRVAHNRIEKFLSSSNVLGEPSKISSNPKTAMAVDEDSEPYKRTVAEIHQQRIENDKDVVIRNVSKQNWDWKMREAQMKEGRGDDGLITQRVTDVTSELEEQPKDEAVTTQYGMLTLDDIPRIVASEQAREKSGEGKFEKKSWGEKRDRDSGAFKNLLKKITGA